MLGEKKCKRNLLAILIFYFTDYVIFYGRESEYLKPTKPQKTDYDVLREEYRYPLPPSFLFVIIL